MNNKYVIEFIYTDGTKEQLVGVGRSGQTEEEYLVDSAESGVQIIRRKDKVVGYSIRPYTV